MSKSLGYKPDEIISKADIAKMQLVAAIRLFTEEDFICALTLAGAAEEILARLLNAQGKESIVENSISSIMGLREKAGANAMGSMTKNEIFNYWNNARNSVKHHDPKDKEELKINTFDEAYWMITRALANAQRLSLKITNKDDFDNWCILRLHL